MAYQMKRLEASRLRQRIHQLEASRQPQVRALLNIREAMRRGSLVTLNRKCGKATCHCVKGGGHPAKYLSIKEGGRTRLIYVTAADEVSLSQANDRYRLFREKRSRLTQLSQEQLSLIDRLASALLVREKPSGPRKRSRSNADKARVRRRR
jgi:hypothetical protein